MKRTRTRWQIALTALGLTGVVACTGGAGPLPEFYDGWDDDTGERNNREAPGASTDRPSLSGDSPGGAQDPAPGSAGGGSGGAFVCSGIYACTVRAQGQSVTVNLPLSEKDGKCVIGDGGVLEPDGTFVTEDGNGRWTASGGQLTLTAEGGQIATCVRVADGNGAGTGSGSGGSSSGGEDQTDPAPPPGG